MNGMIRCVDMSLFMVIIIVWNVLDIMLHKERKKKERKKCEMNMKGSYETKQKKRKEEETKKKNCK